MPRQPEAGDALTAFGLSTPWRESQDEEQSFSTCPSPLHWDAFPYQSSSEPPREAEGGFV